MLDKEKLTKHINDSQLKQALIKTIDQANTVVKSHEIRATDFLSPYYEKKVLEILLQFKGISSFSIGGYEEAERKVVVMYPDYLSEDDIEVPIAALEVTSNDQFFTCSHRDYLGAILGLGIKREKIGDILIHNDLKQGKGQIILYRDMKEFLLYHLSQVGKSKVSVREIQLHEIIKPKIEYKEATGNVPSLRLDAVVAEIFNLSRSEAQGLISRELVRVNWEVITRGSIELEANDILSVKGEGRADIVDIVGKTKSGRIKIKYKKPL